MGIDHPGLGEETHTHLLLLGIQDRLDVQLLVTFCTLNRRLAEPRDGTKTSHAGRCRRLDYTSTSLSLSIPLSISPYIALPLPLSLSLPLPLALALALPLALALSISVFLPLLSFVDAENACMERQNVYNPYKKVTSLKGSCLLYTSPSPRDA